MEILLTAVVIQTPVGYFSMWLLGRVFLFTVLVDHIFMFSAVFDRQLQTEEAQQ